MNIKLFLVVSIVLLLSIVPETSAEAPIKLFVNGQPEFSIPPIVKIVDGAPWVSIESISSELKLDVEYDEKNKTVHISNKGEPQSEVVATLKKANATLYATEREGDLEKFRLEINGGIRWFPYWRSSATPAFGPRLFFADINKDGKNELVIILTKGHGTGINITEAHVLEKTNTNVGEIYEEKLIDNPVAIVKKNVKTEIVSGDQVAITIGKKKSIDSINKSFGHEIVDFSVYKNELVVFMSGQLSSLTAGGILITYDFKDNMYQSKKIEYVKKRPDFMMESSFQ